MLLKSRDSDLYFDIKWSGYDASFIIFRPHQVFNDFFEAFLLNFVWSSLNTKINFRISSFWVHKHLFRATYGEFNTGNRKRYPSTFIFENVGTRSPTVAGTHFLTASKFVLYFDLSFQNLVSKRVFFMENRVLASIFFDLTVFCVFERVQIAVMHRPRRAVPSH